MLPDDVNTGGLRRFIFDAARQMWRRHRLRTLLSSLGVMCGVASVVAMLTIGEGARRETLHQISRLGLENVIVRTAAGETDDPARWRDNTLLVKDRTVLDGLRLFDNTTILRELDLRPGESESKEGMTVLATEPAFARIYGLIPAEGRFLHPTDIRQDRRVCVIGADVARGLGPHGRIGATLTLGNEIYTIVGRLASTRWSASRKANIQVRNYNQCIFIPASLNADDDVSEIIVHVREGHDVISAGKLVERSLSLSRRGRKAAQIIVPLALLRQAEESQRLFNVILGSIAAISLIVGGIGIMNIMLAGVAERTPEIGLRRAIGATRQDILIQFIVESVLIGVIGALCGIALGITASIAVSAFGGWPTALTVAAVLLPITMSILVTALAGLYPAWLAARVDPIVALRQSPW